MNGKDLQAPGGIGDADFDFTVETAETAAAESTVAAEAVFLEARRVYERVRAALVRLRRTGDEIELAVRRRHRSYFVPSLLTPHPPFPPTSALVYQN